MKNNNLISYFLKKCEEYSIINLYGESGLGKTTLALQIISNYLLIKRKNIKSCIWIQASENFPKKRLISMNSNNNSILNYLEKNIYIFPKKRIENLAEQNKLFSKLINSNFLPYGLKIVVIDNISHHLRFNISQYSNIQIRQNIQDDFFESIIVPLIFLCRNLNIILIFIHEVSYNPKKEQNIMFNNKLFSRINALNIELFKKKYNGKNKLSLNNSSFSEDFEYEITNIGIS